MALLDGQGKFIRRISRSVESWNSLAGSSIPSRLSAPSTPSRCPPVMNVYFGNDAKVRVLFDPQRLAARLPNEPRK
jgi:hypothetical protein